MKQKSWELAAVHILAFFLKLKIEQNLQYLLLLSITHSLDGTILSAGTWVLG